jgi:hypothetical protein
MFYTEECTQTILQRLSDKINKQVMQLGIVLGHCTNITASTYDPKLGDQQLIYKYSEPLMKNRQ